jgi:hypothetical protein
MAGRKTRKPQFTKRVSLGLRVSPLIKEMLDDAAKQSGRSQSTEAAYRLEKSFERGDLLVDALTLHFSREAAGVALAVGQIVNTHGIVHLALSKKDETLTLQHAFDVLGQRWAIHPASLEMGLVAGIGLLAMLRPPQEDTQSLTTEDRRSAIAIAALFLAGLVNERPTKEEADSRRQARETIRSLLGPTIVEQIKRRGLPAWEDLEQTFQALASAARLAMEKGLKSFPPRA